MNNLPASSVHGILQVRILEWVAIYSSRGSSFTQGLNPHLLHWQADSLPVSYLGSPVDSYLGIKKNEVLIHAPKRLNLRTIELSERRHIHYPADPSTVQGLVTNLQMTSSQLCISKVLPVPQL